MIRRVVRAVALVGIAAAISAACAFEGAAADGSAMRPPPGASSCGGCHGASTVGSAAPLLPPVAGKPAAETVAALAAFRSGERPATVMDRIAKGFSDEESRAIAVWLEGQAR